LIEFRYQGQRIRQKFQVVKETDNDLMVLGIPWLQRLNPDIDWRKRTVTLKKASTTQRRNKETPALKKAEEAKKKPSQDNTKPTGFGKRGGYGGDQVVWEQISAPVFGYGCSTVHMVSAFVPLISFLVSLS